MVSWDRYPDAEPEQAILAQLVEQLLRKHQVIRSSRIDGTIVIGRSIRLATEAVLKTVELVTLALGVRLSHLPPPTIAASEGLTLVSYASWERDRYPRPHPNQRGHSSVGRTLDFHSRCREFKSRCPLHF